MDPLHFAEFLLGVCVKVSPLAVNGVTEEEFGGETRFRYRGFG